MASARGRYFGFGVLFCTPLSLDCAIAVVAHYGAYIDGMSVSASGSIDGGGVQPSGTISGGRVRKSGEIDGLQIQTGV